MSTKNQIKLQLVVDFTFTPNGTPIKDLKDNLIRIIGHAINEGMVTTGTEAEVDDYSETKVIEVTAPDLDRDQIERFITDQIENGNLKLESIVSEMARFGQMEPQQFNTEIADRMAAIEFEGFTNDIEPAPLTPPDIASLGYAISEDSDQPGRYCWTLPDKDGDGTPPVAISVSLASLELAIKAARLHAKTQDPTIAQCNNCGSVTLDSMLVEPKDLSQRVEPGGVVPAGECPHCGALAYPSDGEQSNDGMPCLSAVDAQALAALEAWLHDNVDGGFTVTFDNQGKVNSAQVLNAIKALKAIAAK